MTDVNQHQMPSRHAADNSERAIEMAQIAEQSMHQARDEADPQKLQKAAAQLKTAQSMVADAEEQLSAHMDGSTEQQFTQLQDQLIQAQQDADVASEDAFQPRQMR